MKTTAEIEGRIRFLIARELEMRVRKATERLPHRCTYNHRHPLDTRRTIEDEPNPHYNRITMGIGPDGVPIPVHQTIGLCMYKDNAEDPDGQPLLAICEDPEDAQRCPWFSPRLTKQALWEEFETQIQNPEWLQANLPEVYGLYWTLDILVYMKAPWWLRLIYRFLKIRPEPLRKTTDLMKLLPPGFLMPSFSILEQVLSPERFRQRVSEKRGGYAMPVLGRKKATSEQGPFMVTNARGQFAPTRASREGYVNFGFSPSPPEESQDDLLLAFYAGALRFSRLEGSSTRCSSVREAMDRLRASGHPPRSLILPMATVKEVCGVELQTSESGYVTKIEGDIRVFVAPLPEGAALVLPGQETLGVFTRVGNYVGIVVQRANRTMMVVGRDMA